MNFFTKFTDQLALPQLTRGRIVFAMVSAVVADFLQIVLLPVAWTFVQQVIDVIAMVLTICTIGFHLLLLPTFIIEFIPGVDMLPTWTGCVIAVIALRKRGQRISSQQSPPIVDASQPPNPPPRISDSSSF